MSTCNVEFQMGSYTSWCNTHEIKASTEHQCCIIGAIERAEAAEARLRELEAANAELKRQVEQAQERIAELETLLFGKAVTKYEAQS